MIMNTLNKNISKRIIKIIQKCTDVSYEKLDISNWDEPLTGHIYQFTAVDLVYLLFEIEIEFNIRLPAKVFEDYRFSTITKICSVIEDYVELQK